MNIFSVAISFLLVPSVASQSQLTESVLQERIINGVDAPANRYPFTVSLQHIGFHFCGGSLIAPDVVLSAAHCAGETFGGSNFKVQINPHTLSSPLQSAEEFGIQEFVTHPFFGTLSLYDHDYVVIKLDGESTHAPIVLNANKSTPEAGSSLQVVGWGTTVAGESAAADALQEVDVISITNEECEVAPSYEGHIFPDSLCATEWDKGACQGDSGGPLVLRGTDSLKDIQVGVVSWGVGCAERYHPGVYSRISEEYNWLRHQVCRMSNKPPTYFNCDTMEEVTFSPAPTSSPTAPTTSPSPSLGRVSVVLSLILDQYPRETGIAVQDSNGAIVAFSPAGHYTQKFSRVSHLLELDRGEEYVFFLYDSYGDGFDGKAFIYLGTETDDEVALAFYDQFLSSPHFTNTFQVSFVASEDGILGGLYPSSVPSASPSSLPSITQTPSVSIPHQSAPPVTKYGSHPICNICGSSGMMTDPTVSLDHHELYESSNSVQCIDLATLGETGWISPANCNVFSALVFDECGCLTSDDRSSSTSASVRAEGLALCVVLLLWVAQ